MVRAEYEKELKELGSGEEDNLEVFDEEAADEARDAIDTDGPPEDTRPVGVDKGKGRALEEAPSSRRKRPRVRPPSGEHDTSCQCINRLLTLSRIRKSVGI